MLRSASIARPSAKVVVPALRFAREAQRRQAEAGELAHEGLGLGKWLALDDAADEADGKRLLRLDHATAHHQFQRAGLADEPGQALGAAVARNQAQLDFRQAQPGLRHADPKGAGHRQFQPAAQGIAIDEAERGDAQGVQFGEGPLATLGPRLLRLD